MRLVLPPEEFAESVATHLVELQFDGSLQFDRQGFALVLQSGTGNPLQTINLSSFYSDYSQDPNNLQEILKKIASLTRGTPDVSDYESIAPYLMLNVFDRSQVMFDWHKIRRDHGSAAGTPVLIEIAGGLVLGPVIDTGNSLVHVTSTQLNMWSRTAGEVFDRASRNLSGSTEHWRFESVVDSVRDMPEYHQSLWNDGYDAARIAHEHIFLEGLPVKGEKLVFLVGASKLLVTGSDSAIGIAAGLSLLEKSSMPPFVIVSRNGKLLNYVPDKEKQAGFYEVLHRLQTHYFGRSYYHQKEQLTTADVLVNDIFVAEFTVAQNKDMRIASMCTWTEGVETLLPKADSISFVQVESGDVKIVARTSWEKAMQFIDDRIEQTQDYPPRFRTKGFPTAQQINAMGIHDIF
jgi:Protein of unknown function (DUF1444).